ncbi:MAG: 30S ribosomal protein S19e [Candidatus Lokiarchaeota archaeon]|nr:30S ribosomal protein S19e [Candidatus Lokiarchaeota archaeon]
MPTVYDVYPQDLIKAIAEILKNEYDGIKPPKESIFWKTASFKEIAPVDEDFWYVRAASLLRKLYIKKVIGVNKLRKIYGGRSKNHVHKKHSLPASGAIIRRCLQQLESVGLVKTIEGSGRALTPKGMSLLDKTANTIYKEQPVEYFTHLGVSEED